MLITEVQPTASNILDQVSCMLTTATCFFLYASEGDGKTETGRWGMAMLRYSSKEAGDWYGPPGSPSWVAGSNTWATLCCFP